MTWNGLKPLVQSNWHLLTLLLVVVVAIPLFALRSQQAAPATPAAAAGKTEAEDLAQRVEPTPKRATDQDQVRETILSHQMEFEKDPKSEKAPALLSAMGNLYRQRLGDYQQAASCFEKLINDYPESSSVRDAYLQLVVCYARLGDLEARTRVLRRILNAYPPDSEMYKFAEREIGG